MTDEKIFASLESLIATLMQQSKIPSLAVAVVQDDKTIYSKAFGARTLKENKPASLDTLYGIGSCTKSFTCLALLQLTEQGKLKLTDPISKYLPFKIGFEDSPITIHHFMSHSSGIPNLGVASVIISRYVGKNETYIPMSSFEDIINHVNGAQNEIASKPGEKYFYNNSAYLLLGEIIAKVSGMSYEEYIKENILKPLGMTRSTFSREDFDQDADTMTAYFTEPDQDLIPSLHPFDQFIYSAGGLLSSVNELIKY
ncbi:MAG: beta-lactamase family protein [Asgard group archaeon]|nr:beta-lactamase family protein [Asgard group archaeon]